MLHEWGSVCLYLILCKQQVGLLKVSKEPRGKSLWERGLGTKGGLDYILYLKNEVFGQPNNG